MNNAKIANFNDFYKLLKDKPLEEAVKSIGFDEDEAISAYDNMLFIYDGGKIEDFFRNINTEVEDYGVGYCLLSSESRWYEIPYNALERYEVYTLEYDKIYDVTASYE